MRSRVLDDRRSVTARLAIRRQTGGGGKDLVPVALGCCIPAVAMAIAVAAGAAATVVTVAVAIVVAVAALPLVGVPTATAPHSPACSPPATISPVPASLVLVLVLLPSSSTAKIVAVSVAVAVSRPIATRCDILPKLRRSEILYVRVGRDACANIGPASWSWISLRLETFRVFTNQKPSSA